MLINLLKKAISQVHEQKKIIFFFLLSGALTAVVYFTFFALFWHVLHFNHIIAVSIAYSVAASFHFFANRNITFNIKSTNYINQMMKYIMLLTINYLITILGLEISLLFVTSPYVGLILVTGVTTIVGYLLSKHWVFKLKPF